MMDDLARRERAARGIYGARLERELKPGRRRFDAVEAALAAILFLFGGLALVFAAVVIWLFVVFAATAARAQECKLGDFGCGHSLWHHWYSTAEDGKPLTRPYGPPNVSCCGVDCRPTLAKFRDGQWWVLIDGQFDPVPADRIKQRAVSPNGMAHVCAPRRESAAPVTPYCFVRPGGDS